MHSPCHWISFARGALVRGFSILGFMLTVRARDDIRFHRRRKLNKLRSSSPNRCKGARTEMDDDIRSDVLRSLARSIVLAGNHPSDYCCGSMQVIRGDPDWRL